jgi:hypothetical protein
MEYRLSRRRPALLVPMLLTVLLLAGTGAAVPAQAHRVPDQGAGAPGWSGDQWPHPDLAPVVAPSVTTESVAGKVAMMRTDGKAAIPRNAPKRVRRLIRQANRIIGKPYKWGGGHAKLNDRGYDCSGSVSFALIKARLLESTMVSGSFKRWGLKGLGRYVTVYARNSHVYMEVVGLRLDTSSVGDIYDGGNGVRWRNVIGKRDGFAVRHPAQL